MRGTKQLEYPHIYNILPCDRDTCIPHPENNGDLGLSKEIERCEENGEVGRVNEDS